MGQLVLAASVFVGSHLGIASTPARPWLVARLGARGYLVLYAAVALAAIVWLVVAYRVAPHVGVWHPRPFWRWLALAAMLPAAILFVAGMFGPNPTAVGQEKLLAEVAPATGMLRVTRHPMMWAFAIWAIVHMLARGDLAALVFFGSFAVLALAGTIAIDHRRATGDAGDWARFTASTSNIPFAAILAGRQRLVPAEIGAFPAVLALVLYLAMLVAHPFLFGASPLP